MQYSQEGIIPNNGVSNIAILSPCLSLPSLSLPYSLIFVIIYIYHKYSHNLFY